MTPGEPPLRILMRCDAGRRLGSGHVMRCLTLAHALAGRGAAVGFACSAETSEIVPALGASGFPVITLAAPLDAGELVASGRRWDAMIVDHYGLEARHETALRQAAPVILVIDDLADRPHDCDILVDQTAGRESADYFPLVAPATDLRLGARYALLRPEFARARAPALAARAKGAPVSRILVSLGMTDIDGVTAWAVKAALAAGLDAEIAVAVGSRAGSVPELRGLAAADRRIKLYLDCADMCALMASSDIAIGAGGMTSWERCCLGLPTIMLVMAENQTLIAGNLARMGAAELLPERDAAALSIALRRLAAEPAARVAMSQAASAVTDGLGAERVSQKFLRHLRVHQTLGRGQSGSGNLQDNLPRLCARSAEIEDAEEIWDQRNDPITRRNARTGDLVPWREHTEWFSRALNDPNRLICMVDAPDLPEGIGRGMAVVRFDPCETRRGCWLLSISLAPAFRGLHLATSALRAACSLFLMTHEDATLCAEIGPVNIASSRIFTALGFHRVDERRTPGFDLFVRPPGAFHVIDEKQRA